MTNAAITPGTQPQKVKSNTIRKDPQPLPKTDNGGKIIANNTLIKLIDFLILIDVLYVGEVTILLQNPLFLS